MSAGGHEQGHTSSSRLVHASTSHPTSSSRRRLWRRTFGGAAVVCLAITAAATATATAAAAAAPGGRAQASSASSTNQQDAVATYNALQQNLYVASRSLYGGGPSNSCGTYSCLWPFTNAAAGTVYLYGTPNGASYLSNVTARQTGLGRYADPSEVSPAGVAQPPAYQSAVARPLGPGGATYYDDNGWVGLNLIHAYLLTSNGTYLTLAQDELNFIMSGWDTNASDGCPGRCLLGGCCRKRAQHHRERGRRSARTRVGPAHREHPDLNWATSVYQWVVHCLGTASGLYNDHVNPNGSVNTTIWSYNQGVMVGAGVLLYQLTGNGTYLAQAQQTAAAAVSYFGTGTVLVNQGPAFNAIYFRNLFLLNQVAPNAAYASEAQSFATTMWAQRQTGTGLIDPQYGVNGTAPMVRSTHCWLEVRLRRSAAHRGPKSSPRPSVGPPGPRPHAADPVDRVPHDVPGLRLVRVLGIVVRRRPWRVVSAVAR